jgi:hypothetical protein
VYIASINIPTIHKKQVFGGLLGKLADTNGCPTTRGLALHTIVYILLVRGSMDLKLFD